MKKMYSRKLIIDYITGEYIENIEELEDDYSFMLDVITSSRDKNFYNLCSKNVKNNFVFVKSIIEMFKDDINFIIKVANNYLKNHDEEEINSKEIIILMHNISSKYCNIEDMELSVFSLKALAIFEDETEKMNEKYRNENETEEEYILDFYEVVENYNHSKTIKDFFAKKLINVIFLDYENYSLEQIIHYEFDKFEILEQYGINRFLINYIDNYDDCLAQYVSCNVKLLEPIKNYLKVVKKNWEFYVSNINLRKIDIYNYELSSYLEKYEDNLSFNSYQLIVYVIDKLNLKEKFLKYDKCFCILEESEKLIFDESLMNIQELKCIKYAIDLAKRIFNANIIETDYNDYEEEKINEGAKVIRVDFVNKKLI